MTEAPIVALEGVTKRFGRVRALRGIDLTLGRGEVVAVFGANGAGKSTLLHVIAGLARPDAGQVLHEGRPVGRDPLAFRRALGYLSHRTMLHDSLSVRQNLVFAGRLHGVRQLRSRIDQLLRALDLHGRADDAVRTLSRGLQQRAAIARALLHEPRVLLLDEPHAGLDQQAAEGLRTLLSGLKRRGRSVLLVTHELSRGWESADRAVVLRDGRVVLEQPVSAGEFGAFEAAYGSLLASGAAAAFPVVP